MTTTEPRTETTEVLTDEMLARFDERAPTYDRENRFFDEDFAELKASGYLDVAIPTELGGAGLRLDEYVAAGPPPRLLRPGHRAGRQHARLLDRRRRRPPARRRRLVPLHPRRGGRRRGALRPPRRGRQRPPAAAVERDGRARRRRLVDQRAQDLRQPHAGVDARRLPRHGHLRPGGPADRPRLPAPRHRRPPDRRDVGHARHAGDAEPGHRARQGVRARRARRAGVPGRLRRRRAVPGVDLRLGAAGLLGDLPRRRRAGVRHDDRADAAAHVGRADPLDGAPPRGAAQRRRDAHRPRRRRGAARAHRRRLGGRRRARRLAGAPRRHPSVRDQQRLSTSSTGRSTSAAAPAPSSAAASSSSSATCGWAASTPATRCWPTSSSASSASASTPTPARAGADDRAQADVRQRRRASACRSVGSDT